MGVKLNNMRYLLLLIFYITLSSCTSSSKGRVDNKWADSKILKEGFKNYVLCECLLKGYGNAELRDQIKSIDKSFSSPLYYTLFDSLKNEILKPVIQEINRDSIRTAGRVSESAAGKHVFSRCIAFYKSKNLEFITEKEYKNWKAIKNLDSLISLKVPAY